MTSTENFIPTFFILNIHWVTEIYAWFMHTLVVMTQGESVSVPLAWVLVAMTTALRTFTDVCTSQDEQNASTPETDEVLNFYVQYDKRVCVNFSC